MNLQQSSQKKRVPESRSEKWKANFCNLKREHGFEKLVITGKIPEDLQGTLYRNGPSSFDVFGKNFEHWFDGDGAISAVRINGGEAFGAIRFVETKSRKRVKKAGKELYGNYGTPAPFLRRIGAKPKNTANTSVFAWQKRVFALQEASLPTEISQEDLSTIGENNLGGVLSQSFSAHPHRVSQRKCIYNFALRFGRETFLDIFSLPDEGEAKILAKIPLSGATMIHDFIATSNYLIFFISPLRLRVFPLLLGMGSFSENLQWKSSLGTEILIVPIDTLEKHTRFPVESFYQWHFGNAFEKGNEIIVDFVKYDNFSSNEVLKNYPKGISGILDGCYFRAVIDPERKRFSLEKQNDIFCEFPRVSPRVVSQEYRYAYATSFQNDTDPFLNQITKIDINTGKSQSIFLGEEMYPSEPVFVPKTSGEEEDDGYLLVLVYNGKKHTSHLAILDAKNLEDGPLARAHFDHHIPYTFHGGWAPSH